MSIEECQNEFAQQTSRIIGAVVNGLNEKLLDFEFDFICLISKNHISKRTSVSNTIAKRFARSRKMHTKTIVLGDDKIVLMINYAVPPSVIDDLQRNLIVS